MRKELDDANERIRKVEWELFEAGRRIDDLQDDRYEKASQIGALTKRLAMAEHERDA
jgi:predicted  nucleic acid-binding Zn-ribbon protein